MRLCMFLRGLPCREPHSKNASDNAPRCTLWRPASREARPGIIEARREAEFRNGRQRGADRADHGMPIASMRVGTMGNPPLVGCMPDSLEGPFDASQRTTKWPSVRQCSPATGGLYTTNTVILCREIRRPIVRVVSSGSRPASKLY